MPDLTTMSETEKNDYIKSLEAKVADMPKPKDITVKISENTGCIVVGGLTGRYPVSLYRSIWKRLLTKQVADIILKFIKEHDAEITATMTKAGKRPD